MELRDKYRHLWIPLMELDWHASFDWLSWHFGGSDLVPAAQPGALKGKLR